MELYISLVCDIPLFIYPMLIFNSTNEKYKELHKSVIKYFHFLAKKIEQKLEGAENIGIELNDDRMDFESNDEKVIAKRNTRLFHYNLLQKYKGKECYLCGCDIEKVIQGAHIYSASDILHSSISEEEKAKQIVDADNGMWLCANHHLLFDYLLIYFRERYLYASDTLNKTQIEYIKESITPKYFLDDEKCTKDKEFLHFKIDDSDFNLNMKQYLSKHTIRFTKQDNNKKIKK